MTSYYCGNCERDYRGPGHVCGEERAVEEATVRETLWRQAKAVWDRYHLSSDSVVWGYVIQAIAAEVLTDPRGYARALGLPEPPYSIVVNTPKPDPCPDCGCHVGHLTGCTYMSRALSEPVAELG